MRPGPRIRITDSQLKVWNVRTPGGPLGDGSGAPASLSVYSTVVSGTARDELQRACAYNGIVRMPLMPDICP